MPEELLEVSAFAAGLSALEDVAEESLPLPLPLPLPDDDEDESVPEDVSLLLFDESLAEEAGSLSLLFFLRPLASSRESLR